MINMNALTTALLLLGFGGNPAEEAKRVLPETDQTTVVSSPPEETDLVVTSDLIDAPDEVQPGGFIDIVLDSDLKFEIDPKPEHFNKWPPDERGHVLLIIRRAKAPGYTITVSHQVLHPTKEERATGREKYRNDWEAYDKYLEEHSRDQIFHDSHFVKVGEPTPPIPPTPDLTEFSKAVVKLADGLDKGELKAVAQNYSGIASAIGSDIYSDLELEQAKAKIIRDVSTLNKDVLQDSDQREEWTTFGKKLAELIKVRTLDTLDAVQEMFDEISKGLLEASK